MRDAFVFLKAKVALYSMFRGITHGSLQPGYSVEHIGSKSNGLDG